MNGILVGKLEKDPKTTSLKFSYEKNWLSLTGARPISLSLPLSEKIYTGDLVFNFFDNLLPDNIDIRKRIQTLFSVRSHEPFDFLAAIGKDCVGALQPRIS